MKNTDLEKFRVKTGLFGSPAGANYGFFFVPMKIGATPLKVMSSPLGEGEWDHVSVSLPNRCPTWDEMCHIKKLFFGPDRQVVQFHPPEKDYVNNHPFCLHLWAYNIGEMVAPPSILVGVKAIGNITGES